MEARHIIRAAIAGSVLGHLALVTGFFFADARPFAPVQTIAVEVVSPDQIPPIEPEVATPAEPEPARQQEPAKQDVAKQEAKPEPQFRLPELSPVEREQSAASQQSPQSESRPPSQPAPEQQAASQPAEPPKESAAPEQAQSAEPPSPWLPQLSGGARPQQSAPTPPPPEQAQAANTPPAPEPDITVKYGVALGLPDGDGGGLAMQKADLRALDIAAFKRHLKTCSHLPATVAVSDQVKVVLRVLMSPDGKLRGEPEVMEAQNSRKAPALMRAAVNGLKACQPYTMLPPDKYSEWRMLDLVFTPDEFSGG